MGTFPILNSVFKKNGAFSAFEDMMTSAIFGYYQTGMRKILFWGFDHTSSNASRAIRSILGLLLIEAHQMIKIGALTLLGCKRKIHWYNLNPKKLPERQAAAVPLLLVHGRMHNQGIWISLAKAMQKANLATPVYTLNLGCGNEESMGLQISKKMDEIREEYRGAGKEDPLIDLLGYSDGGYVIHKKYLDHPFELGERGEIGGIVFLGFIGSVEFLLRNRDLTPIYEILGSNDFVCNIGSVLPEESRTLAQATHLGLPFSSEAHEQIIRMMGPRTQLAAKTLKRFKLSPFASSAK